MSPSLDIQTNRVIYLIKKSKIILLIGHKRPDSDTVGSALALNLALKRINKKVIPAFFDDPSLNLSFLPGFFEIKKLSNFIKEINNIDLIIALDCGSYELTGLKEYLSESKINPPLINIDHHHDSTLFGLINILQPNASSTAEIIYHLLLKIKIPLNKDISTCLLTGIFGDTDSFKNPNTTEKTLRITSNLLANGANLRQITKHTLQGKSFHTLRLWGRVLSRIRKHKELGIVSSVVTLKDLQECNVSPEDLEGIANFLNSIPEAQISMILYQRKNEEIKGSLRTLQPNIDVSRLAHLLGGGGHKKAAGFVLNGKIEAGDNNQWKIVL